MIPPSVKERLLRLQHENKRLKAAAAEIAAGGGPSGSGSSISGSSGAPELLQAMVDDLREREKSLVAENR